MTYLEIFTLDPAEGLAVGVLRYEHIPGTFSYNAPSDLDYFGYTEVEWDLLDSAGRVLPAPSSEAAVERIEELIHAHMRD